ncbi:hypothetical protein [Sphingorhabdus sp. SMR4y]|uniref:hypothetical protein n=1 Tax=Sphingorhabdus sp. SMR4y TaxID=2584094 RepID=UPI000B611B62|nr:hypothetical protein [Sphingorhabdus sp. SMR4y]ASK88440.1 hypothetical protein SPHFLASMR4Y_01693 [Sphingorhabdus sp. SMR4y]
MVRESSKIAANQGRAQKLPYEKPVLIEIELEDQTDGKATKITEAGTGQGPS